MKWLVGLLVAVLQDPRVGAAIRALALALVAATAAHLSGAAPPAAAPLAASPANVARRARILVVQRTCLQLTS